MENYYKIYELGILLQNTAQRWQSCAVFFCEFVFLLYICIHKICGYGSYI